jgi:hypothetical protein
MCSILSMSTAMKGRKPMNKQETRIIQSIIKDIHLEMYTNLDEHPVRSSTVISCVQAER